MITARVPDVNGDLRMPWRLYEVGTDVLYIAIANVAPQASRARASIICGTMRVMVRYRNLRYSVCIENSPAKRSTDMADVL